LHVARLKHGSPSTRIATRPGAMALRAWTREQGDATPYVFSSLRGGPMTRRTVHYVVAEAAGIGFPVHPHMLRHATGCYPANAGQDTRAIQLYLGHKNIHTVRYTELRPAGSRISGRTNRKRFTHTGQVGCGHLRPYFVIGIDRIIEIPSDETGESGFSRHLARDWFRKP
jgi:hypothetical protein